MEHKRCKWATNSEYSQKYHDEEWGKPAHDDNYLFEMLILEGMQAGLSWEIILKKRAAMRKAFHAFSITRLAELSDEEIEVLMSNKGIIRNRLKLQSLRQNALAFQKVQEEFESFANYLWAYTDNQPLVNHYQEGEYGPVSTELSTTISKDLKRRGFNFVGSTIIYSYLQAVGLVNDHEEGCEWK